MIQTTNLEKVKTNQFAKVIFLDIEGVVVTHRSILFQHCPEKGEHYRGGKPGWHRFIDDIAMALVYKLAVDYDAQIVLTSTLKGHPNTYAGLCCAVPIWLEDPTMYLAEEYTEHMSSREDEIRAFIKKHNVEKHVVFDDRDLLIPNFIQCDPCEGITYANYHSAKFFLTDNSKEVTHEAIYL